MSLTTCEYCAHRGRQQRMAFLTLGDRPVDFERALVLFHSIDMHLSDQLRRHVFFYLFHQASTVPHD